MWEKIKELLEYNLTEVLFMIAISFLVLFMESIGVVLTLNLMSTMGILGFLIGTTGMSFVGFIWLFMMVSIWENL
jgi:hypothetical protein|nr:MAG TPA: hypothetical protein [Caudoviricetes sp.]